MEDFKQNLVNSVGKVNFCNDCMSLVRAYKRVCAVVAVVAMSSAMLNAAEPIRVLPADAEQLAEVIVLHYDEKPDTIPNEKVDTTQVQKTKNPTLPGSFADLDVQEIIPATIDGDSERIVFAKTDESKYAAPNQVDDIYYIPHDFKDGNKNHHLPKIIGLVYHNLPDGKDYLSVKTVRYVYRLDKDYKPIAAIFGDYRLDDVSAQYLLDFRTNDTKWKNATGISVMYTNSPDPAPPNIIDLTPDYGWYDFENGNYEDWAERMKFNGRKPPKETYEFYKKRYLKLKKYDFEKGNPKDFEQKFKEFKLKEEDYYRFKDSIRG